jgi:hypothetical protein
MHCRKAVPVPVSVRGGEARIQTFSMSRGERRSARRVEKGERAIWQRHYWEHLIRDERDLAAHMDYVHFNPVKHRHVARVEDWPCSTFQRHGRTGTLPSDWQGRSVTRSVWATGSAVRKRRAQELAG